MDYKLNGPEAQPNRDLELNCYPYDECMLHYSGESFFSRMDIQPGVYFVTSDDVAQSDLLYQVLDRAIYDLATRASGNGSDNDGQLKYFATGEVNFTSSQTLYNLVQCTPDLSWVDCRQCLRAASYQLLALRRTGARVLSPSCNMRYALYQFYASRAGPWPSPSSSSDGI